MEKQIESGNDWENLNSEVEGLLSQINSRNYEYAQRISGLERELERKAREIEVKNESLRKIYEELKENEGFRRDNEELKKALDLLRRKNMELEGVINEKELNLVTLNSALRDKNFEVEKIWKSFEETRAEINETRGNLRKKDERIEGLLGDLEALKLEVLRLNSSLENSESGFENKISILKRELQEKEKEIGAKNFSLKEQLEENAGYRAELEKKSDGAAVLQEKLSEKSALLSSLKLRLEEAENALKLASLKNREPRLLELSENLRKKGELISDLETALRGAEARNQLLEKEKGEFLKLNALNNSQLKKLEAEMKKSAGAVSSMKAELNGSENRNAALLLEKNSLAGSLAEKEKELALLAENLRGREEAVSRLQAGIKSSEAGNLALKREKEELARLKDGKNAELEALNGKLKDKSEALSSELDSFEKKNSSQREEIKKLAAETEMLKSAVRERENEIEILNGNIRTLEEEVGGYKKISQKINSTQEEKVSCLNKELLAEKGRYLRLNAEFEKVKKAYADIMEEFNINKSKLDSLLSDRKDSKSEYDGLLGKKAAEIEELKAGYEARIAEVLKNEKGKYSNLIESVRELQVSLNEKEELIGSLKKDAEILRREKGSLIKREEEFEKKYNEELRNEITLSNENRKAMEEKEKYIKELLLGINVLKNEIGGIKVDYDILREEKSKPEKARNARAQAEREARIKKLEAEIKERNKKMSELQKQLLKSQKEKEAIAEKNSARAQALARKYEEMSGRRPEADSRAKDRRIAELKEECSRLEKSFADFKNDISTKHNMLPVKDFWEIIAGVSHQIANSISIIKSHAQLCVDAPGDFDRSESLSAILRSINSLQGKIEEISIFSKPVILQNKYVKLREVLDIAVSGVKSRPNTSEIDFEIEEDRKLKELKLDHIRFSNALEELLLNAAEAMDGKGKIRVTLKESVEKDSQLVIISDSGTGIEENKINYVFEPFFTTKHQKLGLGLSIAKNIIKAHGGDISVDSKYGKGTTVYIKMFEV